MNYDNISSNKYSTLISIINNKSDSHFINELDALLLKKRFDNAYELSLTESILHVSSYNLTSKNIKKIINDFFKLSAIANLGDNRNLYELVKLGNLSSDKLERAIDADTHTNLINTLDNVSRETTLISFDFLILRIYDSFMLKSNVFRIKKEYAKAKHRLFKKLLTFNYDNERREKETTFLCWIDRLLYAVMNKEITASDFVLLCKKIFGLITKTIYFYWKVLHSVNYILLQQDFSSNPDMRLFKKEVLNSISNMYNIIDMSLDEVKELMASILAKKTPDKEDFYYLFDSLKITARKNEEYKLFSLKLCKYIVNFNHQHNIFCYRFIRKYFIESFFDIINNQISNAYIIVEEISALITLFHIDTYFCFNRTDILVNIIKKLKSIDETTTQISHHNFYKFCDSLDYIIYENRDILTPDILKLLKVNSSKQPKLSKCFRLLLCKYS